MRRNVGHHRTTWRALLSTRRAHRLCAGLARSSMFRRLRGGIVMFFGVPHITGRSSLRRTLLAPLFRLLFQFKLLGVRLRSLRMITVVLVSRLGSIIGMIKWFAHPLCVCTVLAAGHVFDYLPGIFPASRLELRCRAFGRLQRGSNRRVAACNGEGNKSEVLHCKGLTTCDVEGQLLRRSTSPSRWEVTLYTFARNGLSNRFCYACWRVDSQLTGTHFASCYRITMLTERVQLKWHAWILPPSRGSCITSGQVPCGPKSIRNSKRRAVEVSARLMSMWVVPLGACLLHTVEMGCNMGRDM